MSTESRPLAKVLFFIARDASRRPFGGDSRVLRFQTKYAYRWGKYMKGVIEQRRLQAELAARAAERRDMP